MAPMSVHMTEDGSVSDAEIAYTERRAMGGRFPTGRQKIF